MKTEHWTGEMPCNINGFRKTESLIEIYPDNQDRFLKHMESAGLKKIEQKETEFAYILIGNK